MGTHREPNWKWRALLASRGLQQKDLVEKLGWYDEKISRIVTGGRNPNRDDLGEIAKVLCVSPNEVAIALSQAPFIPNVTKTCPWCAGDINIPAKDIYEAMENAPSKCPNCRKKIEIREVDDEGTLYFWFTTGKKEE
jgi:hypothetical protein